MATWIRRSAIVSISEPTRLGGAEDDPGVGFLGGDGIPGKLDEVPDVLGNEGATFSGGVG